MSNLSTFYPAPITAADLGLGAGSNATFGSIQNTPIGNTTPSTGAFTTLSANNGTLTASAPALNINQTWNEGSTVFVAAQINATRTASNADSELLQLSENNSAVFRFRRTGQIVTGALTLTATSGNIAIGSNSFWFGNAGSAPALLNDGVNTALGLRNGTNPMEFRVYNTSSSSNANYERGFMRWSSNVLQIGTEKAGTGSARGLSLQTDGIERVAIDGAGSITTPSSIQLNAGGIILNSSGSFGINFFNDTGLRRDEAGAVGQRLGTTAQAFRVYNTSTSSNANFERVNFRWASNEFIIDAQAGGTGTSLRGIKIGSATSSLLGFYGVTPVDQPATVADPAGGGTVDTEARTAINAIIDRLQELGLIA